MFVFASLVNPRLDLDLLPHWIGYYSACRFDRYVITLHDDGINLRERMRAETLFKHVGWEVRTISGAFDNGFLQEKALKAVKDELDPDSYLVLADSDEFHDIEPYKYRKTAEQYDYLGGYLIDRWGEKAIACNGEDLLEYQYPNEGDIYYEAAKKHCGKEPEGNWEFNLVRRKVLCCKAYMPIDLQGSHNLEGEKWPPKEITGYSTNASPIKVLHYSWRKSCLDRMMTKTYFPTWIMAAVLELLGEGPDTEIGRKLVVKMMKDQEEKGWLPT